MGAIKSKWQQAKPVLVFNSRKILVLIANSVNAAARFSNLQSGNISQVCNGNLISLGNYYFRYINPNIEMELSDIGNLRLEEYDEQCGVTRPYYTGTKMIRQKNNIKYYKKEAKNENNKNNNSESD